MLRSKIAQALVGRSPPAACKSDPVASYLLKLLLQESTPSGLNPSTCQQQG